MIPNYIGESLAALIPAFLSLAQGLGQNPGCRNVTYLETNMTTNLTANVTKLEPIQIQPNFSVDVYFILLFLLLSISMLSFTMLNFCNVSKRSRMKNPSFSKIDNRVKPTSNSILTSDELEFNSKINDSKEKIIQQDISASSGTLDTSKLEKDNKLEKRILFSIILSVSFICYGILPGNILVFTIFYWILYL
jgi:hypothetical protein